MNGTQNSGSAMPPSLDVVAVSKWLKVRGFADYAPRFAESKINMAELSRLSEKDLERLGVDDPAQRTLLIAEISRWKEEPSMTMQILMPGATPKEATDLPGLQKPKPAFSMPAPAIAIATPAAPAAMAGSPGTVPPPEKIKLKKRWGAGFLFLSIAAHLLFGVFAYVYIVHVFTPKKLVFKGGPPSPNPGQKSMEHKVKMRKQQNAMSAPAPVKRVTTTGQTKITLPEMPVMPTLNSVTPTAITGVGGVGTQFGTGSLMGTGGDGGGGGGNFTPYGFSNRNSQALEGTFWDFRVDKDLKPTGMNGGRLYAEVVKFLKSNWDVGLFGNYCESPNKIYATRIFTPIIKSEEGPKAYGINRPGNPYWVMHYVGKVTPPESGTYYFVGSADAFMFVRFEGRLVLDASFPMVGGGKVLNGVAQYNYDFNCTPGGFTKGKPIEVVAGQTYDIEILVGDEGGVTIDELLIEKEGVKYDKDPHGNPILPVFRLSDDPPPHDKKSGPNPVTYVVHTQDGPVWQAKAPVSIFPSNLLK